MTEKRCIRCGPVEESVEIIYDKDLGNICVICLEASCVRVGIKTGICALPEEIRQQKTGKAEITPH